MYYSTYVDMWPKDVFGLGVTGVPVLYTTTITKDKTVSRQLTH